VYQRSRVRELWLVRPTDRTLIVYRLENNGYGRPDVFELAGSTRPAVLPAVSIEWERVV
jgi:Uma2 family endonuclease